MITKGLYTIVGAMGLAIIVFLICQPLVAKYILAMIGGSIQAGHL